MDSIIIPRRAKQAVIPFQLDPNTNPEKAKIQIFSYISENTSNTTRILGIYPDSYEKAIKEDISFKHLYAIKDNGEKDKTDISFSVLLKNIPKLTIREYIPDPRIDSAVNFMVKFYEIITGLFEKSKDKKRDQNNKPVEPTKADANNVFDKIGKFSKWAFDYITGTGSNGEDNSLFYDVKDEDAEKLGNASGLGNNTGNKNLKNAIFNLPFTMYYLFQSSLTTNIYEFPFVTSDGKIYSSSGHEGWTTGYNEFSISGLLGKVPIAGTLLKNTLGNISINYLPWWDAESGHKTAEPDITVKFHLFNDNISKAITNFICVNTLIANNKWIQYNLFQHSSSLYEIKLDGSNRLFACTMNAVVRGIGNFRTPPNEFSNQIKAHCENLANDNFAEKLVTDRLVKIPDVYEVELTFKSIIPANINNFLYQYSADKILDKDAKPYRKEQVTTKLETAVNNFKDKAVDEFKKTFGSSSNSGNENRGSGSGGNDSIDKLSRVV